MASHYRYTAMIGGHPGPSCVRQDGGYTHAIVVGNLSEPPLQWRLVALYRDKEEATKQSLALFRGKDRVGLPQVAELRREEEQICER